VAIFLHSSGETLNCPGQARRISIVWSGSPGRFDEIKSIVRTMNADGKLICEICHAGWVLISAGILEGKRVTSTPGIRDDMTNAGATWVNEPVVADGNIISARRPPDLPAYLRTIIGELKKR
jgi:protease I